jgi:hypothetical protein
MHTYLHTFDVSFLECQLAHSYIHIRTCIHTCIPAYVRFLLPQINTYSQCRDIHTYIHIHTFDVSFLECQSAHSYIYIPAYIHTYIPAYVRSLLPQVPFCACELLLPLQLSVCMYACMYYAYVCMYELLLPMQLSVCMYGMYVCIICMYVLCVCVYLRAASSLAAFCMYVCIYVCMYECMHVVPYSCMHVCVCLFVCVCMYELLLPLPLSVCMYL